VITIFAAPETVKISTWDPGRAQGMRSDSTWFEREQNNIYCRRLKGQNKDL